MVGDGGLHVEQVAHLADDVRPDGEHGVACRDGAAEPHVQVGGEAACLALACDDPATHLVDEGGEDAAMHGVDPALEIALGFPLAHNVVAVLKKLHVEPHRIVWSAGKTIILGAMGPQVDDAFHEKEWLMFCVTKIGIRVEKGVVLRFFLKKTVENL